MDAKHISVSRNWLFTYVIANSALFAAVLFTLWLARPEDASLLVQVIATFGAGIAGIAGAAIPLKNQPPMNTDAHR
jgi:hypothetical protein